MTGRKRNWGVQLAVLLLFMSLCLITAFFIFWRLAAPFCGERLSHNIWGIAAQYFPLAGIFLLAFSLLGVLWLSFSERKRVHEPLSRLIRATHEMRDGKLDYELSLSGLGEFTELGYAIEAMRVRLRDSIDKSQKAEAERIDVMNSICHDLMTPVTSILGYAEGVLDGVADTPEKIADYAGIIAKMARRMSNLVEGLNFLTVLENEPPLDLEPLDIGAFLDNLTGEFADEVHIKTEFETGLICAADKQKLSRVFYNLVENAFKYGRPAQGDLLLSFTVKQNGDTALLTMLDNGPGLPAQETRRVFERFYRADPSRGSIGGSGLGLSIVRQIIKLHKGKIWMQNYSSGGLLVSISLPLMNGEGL